jgi:hypothetical protein
MATAAAYPVFDIAEICQEASDRAGIDFRSGYALRSARRALELLLIEWANRGLNLWTIEGPTTIDLTPGVYRYNLPENTVDLIEHNLRTWHGGAEQHSDLPLTRFTVSEYAVIPNKFSQGRPSIISIRRAIQPYFVLWQVPSPFPAYQVVYWRLRRMRPMPAGGTGVPDIPWRFVNALIAGMAFYMSLKSTDPKVMPKIQLLKQEYEEQFGLASDEDRDRASFQFVPFNYTWMSR